MYNNQNRRSSTLCWILSAVAFILLVISDQLSKHLAVLNLKGGDGIVLIDGVFELRYLENRGAAFGMMQNMQFFFVAGAVLICLAAVCIYARMPLTGKYLPLRICTILLCSGAVGNMIDRVRQDYVVDFFYFSLIDFPIFNVADCYVVVACVLFVILILFYYKGEDDFHFLRGRKG